MNDKVKKLINSTCELMIEIEGIEIKKNNLIVELKTTLEILCKSIGFKLDLTYHKSDGILEVIIINTTSLEICKNFNEPLEALKDSIEYVDGFTNKND